jgi:protein SCO1/2
MPPPGGAKYLIDCGFTGLTMHGTVIGMRIFLTLLGASLLLAGGCSRGREYQLKGQVLAVDPAHQEVTIKHEDIPGFMPAMTMPYKVKDGKLLADRTPGDLVTATLVVTDSGAYLSALAQTGHAALTEPPPAVRMIDILEPGTPVPDVQLTDDSGAPRSLKDWRGRVLAVTFIYTRCPLPDFCPQMDRNFAAVQQSLATDPALRDRVALLSVSFDPKVDTPAVLAAHARQAGADPHVWRFATGQQDAIERFAGHFGVSVLREGDGPEALTHNLRTAVIKPDGTLSAVLDGNTWTPAALMEAVKQASE